MKPYRVDGGGIQAAGLVTGQHAMERTLRSLVRRGPVSCPPGTSIGDALLAMQREGTGSIVIVAPEGSPVGIFTRHDVLDRVALARRGLHEPISAVMTPAPRTLTAEAGALNEVERKVLKECLRQARKLQDRLALDHRLWTG